MLLVLVIAFLSTFSLNAEDTQLELVQIVFRHGDRTPVVVYPNDKYNVSFWDKYGGLGQLTQLGMQQHYAYGQFLRQRYSNFLNQMYNKDRVYVHSTDYDRTQMSAQSLLASLYKPVDDQIWNKDVLWQPIPVHTSDWEKIFSNPDKCDRYNQLKGAVIGTDEYTQLTNKYQDVIDIIQKEGGYKTMNLFDTWMICDDVFVQKSHNLTLPSWIENIFDKLMELRDIGFYLDFRTPEMGKLAAGGVLNEIKNNIVTKTSGKSSKAELVLFSSHDTFVAGLTRLLNLTNIIRQPPYTSSVIFELRKSTKTSQRYIQVYLKNNTANEPINFREMTIYGCDFLCPLEKFLDIIQDKIVTDFSSVCKTEPKANLVNTTLILLFSLVALIGLGIILYATFLWRKSRLAYSNLSYERQTI